MDHQKESLAELQSLIDYHFADIRLLITALTHSSYVKGDGANAVHNERLEFLGDAVLELCVSERLYRDNPQMDEGAMTRLRARLVCESALFAAARHIGLSAYLRLSHGEERSGGRQKPSVVSDALEALIGAIYLDSGLDSARRFVSEHVVAHLQSAAVAAQDKDFKTALQEYVQKRHLGKLSYELLGTEGPEHNKAFTMCVILDGNQIGVGIGSTKQSAGQEAAHKGLARLKSGSIGAKEVKACD